MWLNKDGDDCQLYRVSAARSLKIQKHFFGENTRYSLLFTYTQKAPLALSHRPHTLMNGRSIITQTPDCALLKTWLETQHKMSERQWRPTVYQTQNSFIRTSPLVGLTFPLPLTPIAPCVGWVSAISSAGSSSFPSNLNSTCRVSHDSFKFLFLISSLSLLRQVLRFWKVTKK